MACGIALVFGLTAQSSYGGNTALILDSPQGDFVGSGRSWYYTAPTAAFVATRNSHNGVSILVTEGPDCWTIDFAAPFQVQLTPGTYGHCSLYPFEGGFDQVPYDAGLNVSGGFCSYGHRCDRIDGSFVVTELVLADNGSVVSFHAKFTQNCDRIDPPSHGEVLFNSADAFPPEHHITSPEIAYATQEQPFRYQITTSKPESTYSASGLPSGLSFSAASGVISGIPQEHGQYNVTLAATGQSGSTSGMLNLTVDPPGRSTGLFTAIRLLSVLGDSIGQGQEYIVGEGDGTFSGADGTQIMDFDFLPWSYFSNPSEVAGRFYLRFYGPEAVLVPGIYMDTDPDHFAPDVFAEIGLNSPHYTTGSFTIKDIHRDPNGKLEHFRGSFVQFAELSEFSPLRGWVWYKAENVITSWPYAFAKEGTPFAYQIIANNEPSTYSCIGLPPGLSLDQQSGRITGTPNVSGSYTVTLNAIGPSTTASDNLWLNIRPRRVLANISTRAKVGLGNDSLIGGFIVTGPDNKRVIIRAIGPSLGNSGVTNPLSDPILELHNGSGASIALNDDWRSNQAEVEATGLQPSDDRESAIVAALTPGSYTAVITGKNGTTGLGLVEVYDIGSSADAQLANISTRGFVDLNENVMIGGIIVTGGVQSRILLRAIGPSLIHSGISNYLRDPILDLHGANGEIIASNDNWLDSYSQRNEIGSIGLAPSDPFESAVLVSLSAGSYTAVVRGKNNGTGVALVEAYQLDN
jgi:hypothetical protein